MKIIVKAKPNSKLEKVEKITLDSFDFDNTLKQTPVYIVYVKESPVDNKANKSIIKALAKYFKIPISLVEIISGQTSKNKVFNINTD